MDRRPVAQPEAAQTPGRCTDPLGSDADTGPQWYCDIWRSLADHFLRDGFPHLPRHLSGDCGQRVAEALNLAANVVESYMDAVREMEYADRHTADVGRLDEERPPHNFAVVRAMTQDGAA